jgi:hypothetical protein
MKHKALRNACAAVAMGTERLDAAGRLADRELQLFISQDQAVSKRDRQVFEARIKRRVSAGGDVWDNTRKRRISRLS